MTWIRQTLGAVIGGGLVLATAVLTVASYRHAWATRALVLGATMGLIALVSLPVTGVGANPACSFGTAVFASSDTSALGML